MKSCTILKWIKRLIGIVGGVIIGTVIWSVIHTKFIGSIPILPVYKLLFHLSPGIVFGGVLGFYFHGLFADVVLDS
jgi:hypothetical protein